MSLEAKAAERLQAILDEHGALGVLLYLHENATDVLGVANTALNRGALLAVFRLIRDHGKPAAQLHTLLGAIADGAIFARVMATSEASQLEPAERLKIMQVLDECGWRLQRGVEEAQKAARRHG